MDADAAHGLNYYICCVDAQMQKSLESVTRPGALQKVLALQFDAFWQSHGNKVIGAVALVFVFLLWCATHERFSHKTFLFQQVKLLKFTRLPVQMF